MTQYARSTAEILGLSLLLCAGCATMPEPSERTGGDLVREAKTRIVEVEPAALAADAERPLIVDVREPHEYRQGHIPGAVNIPRGVLEFRLAGIDALKDLDDRERLTRPIVLYCRSGARSALATETLLDMGYTNPRSIAGGFKAWQAAELPTEKPSS